jgi:pimeloyl-ACP methyl ester carboxylesterase
MGPGNVADFTAALHGPEAYAAFQQKYFMPMTTATVADVAAGLALAAPWGFDVRSISATAIWAGRQDVTVPYAHGQWLAANVPGAIAHLLDGAGHITLVNDLEEVLVELGRLRR